MFFSGTKPFASVNRPGPRGGTLVAYVHHTEEAPFEWRIRILLDLSATGHGMGERLLEDYSLPMKYPPVFGVDPSDTDNLYRNLNERLEELS